eukprot:GHVQ01013097.1.p1 GENE.GHVQ01013097.1~~GHVQ01013097.1.p1  ORF type:complete len:377 (+),score=38.60 GHVQ01013097.1:160-1290(+)
MCRDNMGACRITCYTILILCCSIIAIPVWYLLFFEVNDGVRFCGTSGGTDVFGSNKRPPVWFRYNPLTNKHDAFYVGTTTGVKNGGVERDGNETDDVVVCLEDIVKYSNTLRSGKDNVVGTADDELTIDQQINLIYELMQRFFSQFSDISTHRSMEYNDGIGSSLSWLFPSTASWIDSPWHLNHNAGVTGQMKVLYADINEYVVVFGNRMAHGGYSGIYNFDLWDYVIEGVHYTQYVGSLDRDKYIPFTNTTVPTPQDSPSVSPTLPRTSGFAVMPRGKQKLYSSAGPDGAILLEYGRGHISSAVYRTMVHPTLFITLDWRSMYYSVVSFAKGVIKNSGGHLFRYVCQTLSSVRYNPVVNAGGEGRQYQSPGHDDL